MAIQSALFQLIPFCKIHMNREQEKLHHRMCELQFSAISCTTRERAILAVAVEELSQRYNFDAMKDLIVLQVATWIIQDFRLCFFSDLFCFMQRMNRVFCFFGRLLN